MIARAGESGCGVGERAQKSFARALNFQTTRDNPNKGLKCAQGWRKMAWRAVFLPYMGFLFRMNRGKNKPNKGVLFEKIRFLGKQKDQLAPSSADHFVSGR
jgi:hypothetical protein